MALLRFKVSLIIFLFFFFAKDCAPTFSNCVTCQRKTGQSYTGHGTLISYELQLACSEEAIESMESKGWRCPDWYPGIEDILPGERSVLLIRPRFQEVWVDPFDTLKWSNKINWYNEEVVEGGPGVTFDVYIDTVEIPEIITIKGLTEPSFNLALLENKTYYWRIEARNSKDEISESLVYSFTTRPKIEYGSFIDSRDGHIYGTVVLGDQTWMTENLVYEGCGKKITDSIAWATNIDQIADAWCFYNNSDSLKEEYGLLYQWDVAKSCCPEGWHLPSIEEFNDLKKLLNTRDETAGNKLKEAGTMHWSPPNYPAEIRRATNVTGFTGLPGGMRDPNAKFNNLGKEGYFWSSSGVKTGTCTYLSYDYPFFREDYFNKNYAVSVRCVKD